MDTTSGGAHRGEFEVIRKIAETMSSGFGDAIDAHPGGVGNEAGAINRAFRMAARVILRNAGPLEDEAGVQTRVLRRIALARLLEVGVIGPRAEGLLDLEPRLGDAWPAYLALAPASVVDDLLGHMVDG